MAGFTIAVLLFYCSVASGANIFEGPVAVYGITGFPSKLEIGDFNNDNLCDIVLLSFDNTLNKSENWYTVLLSNGNGTLEDLGSNLFSGGFYAFVVEDFVSDDCLDFLITKQGPEKLFQGNGDGSFSLYDEFSLGIGKVIAINANEDENADILGIFYTDSLEVFLCDGNGEFSLSWGCDIEIYVHSCAVEDVDLDGHEDIIACCTYNLVICRGKGDGTFLTPEYYYYPECFNWADTGDFNGDGYPDIAITSTPLTMIYPSVWIYLNEGDGTFAIMPDTAYLYGWGDHRGIKAADFDMDGKLDLAVWGPYPIIMPGDGAGFFSDDPEDALFLNEDLSYRCFGVTDLDNDGDLDLVPTCSIVYTFLNTTIPQGFEEESFSSADFSIIPSNNPFTGVIDFVIDGDFFPSQLVVYDITGRQIKKLTNGEGNTFHWDGTDSSGNELSPGAYIVQGSAEGIIASVRVMKL